MGALFANTAKMMKVENPKTRRMVQVRADPKSTFQRIWREPEVRRQLVKAYGTELLNELDRLDIRALPTPVVFTFLPTGSYGVDNDFLHMPMDKVRVVHASAWGAINRSLDRSKLRDTNRACLLDPTRLKYPVCDASGALHCRALLAAEDRGRLVGTPQSKAIAETAAALHAKYCS
jgi:hypothetical protein